MFYMIIKNNRVIKVVRDDKHSEEDFYRAKAAAELGQRGREGVTYELVTGHMEMLADYAEQQQGVVDRVAQLATEILDYSREILDTAGVDDDD